DPADDLCADAACARKAWPAGRFADAAAARSPNQFQGGRVQARRGRLQDAQAVGHGRQACTEQAAWTQPAGSIPEPDRLAAQSPEGMGGWQLRRWRSAEASRNRDL